MSISPRNRYQSKTSTVIQPGGHPTTWESFVRGQDGWNSDDHSQVLTYRGATLRAPGYYTVKVGTNIWKYPRNASSHRINYWVQWGPPSEATSALNSAYSWFKELAVGENSSLGVAFAEWQQSLGMIANRALKLARAARSLRKGDFNGFLRELGVKPKRKHRRKPPRLKSSRNVKHRNRLLGYDLADDVSGLWLEYWFGWAPLYGDIFTAGSIIGQPIPFGSAEGTGKSAFRKQDYYGAGDYQRWDITIRAKMGGDILLENPNLFLLQRVGVLNPASIGWELIPFSFVVDWATGIGAFIDSFTDFAGCSITNAYTTLLYKGIDESWSTLPGASGRTTVVGEGMTRALGITTPIPDWNVSANLERSITRAASAVSLLTQRLVDLRGR